MRQGDLEGEQFMYLDKTCLILTPPYSLAVNATIGKKFVYCFIVLILKQRILSTDLNYDRY